MKVAVLVLVFPLYVSMPSALKGQEQGDPRAAQIESLQKRLNDIQDEVKRIESLRGQMDQIQKELNALQNKTTETKTSTAVTASVPSVSATPVAVAAIPKPDGTIVSTQPLPSQVQLSERKTRQGAGQATRTYDTFSEDPFAVARLYNVPLDPKYSGYFVLPGTQTLMRIGGYAKSDFNYDLRPAGNAEEFVPATIPVPGVASTNNSTVSIRPTRLTADFRIPKSAAGDVRMYFEGDFFGTNATSFRLRHAYAQVANIVVGQTFSNFTDGDTWPDTLDFEGPNSILNARNPQARYGFPVGPGSSVYVSVEKPTSDIAFTVNAGTATATSPAPDGTVRYRYEAERGHIQLAALFRDVAAYLPDSRHVSTLGWGVSSSGLWRLKSDNLVYQIAYGQGISRYINDTSGLGLDASPKSVSDPSLKATPAFAPYVAYQHYWTGKVRSTGTFGYVLIQNSAFDAPSTYHKTTYSEANVIWNPLGSLNVGAEFLYGWRENKNGQHNYAPRIQFSAKYSFIKMKPDNK